MNEKQNPKYCINSYKAHGVSVTVNKGATSLHKIKADRRNKRNLPSSTHKYRTATPEYAQAMLNLILFQPHPF